MADPQAFGRPELRALWTKRRRRYEAVGDGEVRTVRLARLGPAERSALADLLGLARLPGEPATVTVARVDEAVRRGCGLGARELTERLHGPLRDRKNASHRHCSTTLSSSVAICRRFQR